MRICLVIAPNVSQFKSYVLYDAGFGSEERNLTRVSNSRIDTETISYIHIRHPEQMRGYHDVSVVFAGNYLFEISTQELSELRNLANIARLP